ncbi:MAG: response regulator [Hydrogenophaga sp.]|jgi:CheY-like chemotaxis protein|uniref:response regulator n=1 Tax=Hydrogenophaga sp. TaxID=1904254 RepID=UPI00261BF5C0|nr:response regulator [Hydrogenophaga sp.]MCW5672281.1 response regulator [Hydrogenophaga sp.]
MVLQTSSAGQPCAYEPHSSPAGSGLRLLVADDNRDAAESLALLMEVDGHTVQIANDGREALEMAQRLRPDVCILDIGMPGMDGNTVARCLRDAMPEQRMMIVAVTGRAKQEDRALSMAAGFDLYFTKPIPLGELMGSLAQWRDAGAAASPSSPTQG